MLTDSQVLKNRYRDSETFELFNALIDSFSYYMKENEKINLSIDSAEETNQAREIFLAMPTELQKAKLANFLNYYDHCVKMTSRGHSFGARDLGFKSFSFLYGLSVPSEDEVFGLLEKDVYVEIFDLNFLQTYRSPNWLETTSYGLKTLETQDWRNLFFRSDEIFEKQMQIISAIYSGKIKQPVHRPIQIHTVKELSAKIPYCCEMESLLYSPVYDTNRNFVGGLHLMKLHGLRQLDFQIYSEPQP